MATNGTEGETVQRGQVISLTRLSARHREYELRAGERAVGWLRWRPGRRSLAQAESREIGLIELSISRRRVTVAHLGSAKTLATVDRQRGGSIIHAIDGHALRWEKTARGNHWAIREHDDALLSVTASPGLLRSSVRIAVERTMPHKTAVLLCLISGYLALSELQSQVDASAAIGGIVAVAAG